MSDHQDTKRFTRRTFAAVAGGAAAVPALLAQESPPPAAPNPNTTQRRRGTMAEVPPFDRPLEFNKNAVPLKVRPFPLTQVRLTGGIFKAAEDWNRGYMKRLPADRLLHNFRINAGLPSTATSLGGWEEPSCELRGHFTGHYLSAR